LSIWNLNVISDIVAAIFILTGLAYAIGIWRMVRARSRLMLVLALSYMLVIRLLLLVLELDNVMSWTEVHRSVLILPAYVLLGTAFILTYYELKNFHFDAPQSSEDLGALAAQDKEMRQQSVPTKEEQ